MQDIGTLGGPDAFAFAVNERGLVVGFSYPGFAPGVNCFPLATDGFVWDKERGMRDLGTLGGTCTLPGDINDAGQVGTSNLAGEMESHAFLWENGVMRDIGTLGGTFVAETTLNQAGDVVGQSATADGELHAFLWQRGVMTDLGPLPGFGDTTCIGAFGVNAQVQVVGQALQNYCHLQIVTCCSLPVCGRS